MSEELPIERKSINLSKKGKISELEMTRERTNE